MKFSPVTFAKQLIGLGKTKSLENWAKGGDGGGVDGANLRSPYQQSTWVYSCISAISEQVAQIPFRFSRSARVPMKMRQGAWRKKAMGEQIVEGGPLVELFEQPHPHLNRFQFWELLVSWLQLRGEFFAVPLDGNFGLGAARPTSIAVLCPDQLREDIRANNLFGWHYYGSLNDPAPSLDIHREDIISDRLANPFDFWRGMSPLSVARLAADTDFASAQMMKGLVANNASLGDVLRTDQQPDQAQREQMLAGWRESRRRAGTANKPTIIWGGMEIVKPTLSSADMQFLENRKFNRQEICAIFKVPQEIIGFTEDANRSVGDSARLNFIENRIAPLCERIEAALAPFIKAQDRSLCGWFDIECLPIMQKARRERYAGAAAAFAMGVPIDDCSQIFDLGLPDDLPHAGKSYLPFSLQEVGQEQDLPSETPMDPATAVDAAKSNPIARAIKLLGEIGKQKSEIANAKATDVTVLWQRHVRERRASVNLFKGKVSKVLLKFRATALAKLESAPLEKDLAKQRGLIDVIFDAAGFGEALANELDTPLRALLQSAGEALLSEVGQNDPWKYPPQAVLEFIAGRRVKIQDCGTTVRNQINTTLSEGITAGETHAQLAARVKATFNDLATGQAQTIARTEVNLAYNTARQQAMGDAGIQYKAWLSSHGPHVRAGHAQAERDYIDSPIPIDEAFEVDGERLMFPGDDSLGASLGNIINCQCIQLAAQKTGENATSLTFKVFGAGEMTFARGGKR